MLASLNPARIRLVNSTVVAIALIAGPIPVFSQTVGVNSAVRNNVRVRQGATAPAVQAQIRQPVKMGNAITTGTNSGLQVTLLDQSSLTLGPNGSLTVDRFVYNPANKSSSVASSVTKGAFRFMSGRSAAGGRNSMTTPAASIGIRGTILEGAVGSEAIAIAGLQSGLPAGNNADPATATVIVLRGPGPQAPGTVRRGMIDVSAGGRTVTLNQPGNAVFIPRAGAVPIPFQLSNTSFEQFDIALRTQPASFLARSGQQSRTQGRNPSDNASGGQSGGGTGGQLAGQNGVVGMAQALPPAAAGDSGGLPSGQTTGSGTRLATASVKNRGGFFGGLAALGVGAGGAAAALAAQGPDSP